MVKMTITVSDGQGEPQIFTIDVEPNLSPETYERIAAGVLFMNSWCDGSDVDYTWTFK